MQFMCVLACLTLVCVGVSNAMSPSDWWVYSLATKHGISMDKVENDVATCVAHDWPTDADQNMEKCIMGMADYLCPESECSVYERHWLLFVGWYEVAEGKICTGDDSCSLLEHFCGDDELCNWFLKDADDRRRSFGKKSSEGPPPPERPGKGFSVRKIKENTQMDLLSALRSKLRSLKK